MSRLHVIFALIGAWLPAATRAGGPPAAEEARKVRVPLYDSTTGERVAVLEAATVKPEPGNDQILHATTVRILVYQDGKAHISTGKTGTFDLAKKTAVLRGDVILVLDDAKEIAKRTRLKADDLFWEGDKGTARTKGPVTIIRQGAVIEGVGCEIRLKAGPKPAEGEPDRRGRLTIHKHRKTTIQGSLFKKKLTPGVEMPTGRNPGAPGRKEKSKPTTVITNTGPLTIHRAAMTAVYEENVRAVRGNETVTCDRMTIVFRPSAAASQTPSVDIIIAEGHVRIDDGSSIGLAEHATWRDAPFSVELRFPELAVNFQPPASFTELHGRPAQVRWDNGNRITGDIIRRTSADEGEAIRCINRPEQPRPVYLLIQATSGQQPSRTPPAPSPPAAAPKGP